MEKQAILPLPATIILFSGKWHIGMQCVDISRLLIARTAPCTLLLGKTHDRKIKLQEMMGR